jgi:hypothetical protein
VRDLVDFKIYLDISDEIKFAWKIQRDMAERGHSLDSIKKSIEARKPDFDAYIDPQKKHADMIIQVRAVCVCVWGGGCRACVPRLCLCGTWVRAMHACARACAAWGEARVVRPSMCALTADCGRPCTRSQLVAAMHGCVRVLC